MRSLTATRLWAFAATALVLWAAAAAAQDTPTPECRSSADCGPQDPYATTHLACHSDDATGTLYTLYIKPPEGLIFTKATSDGQETSDTSMILYGPSPDDWSDGVQLANDLQAKGLFPSGNDTVSSATWAWEQATRVDTMAFNTANGSSITFSSTTCPGWLNCKAWGGTSGRHCWEQHETCCGDGTMFPQCVRKDNGDQCCTWFKAAATCNATSSCCGMMGPGASSSAFCCGEGTTCCNARVGYSGTASCCPANTKCCAASTIGLCCAMDEECDVTGNRCVAANSSTTTTTDAPTVNTTDAPSSTQSPDDTATTTTTTTAAPSNTAATTTTTSPATATSSPSSGTAMPTTDAPTATSTEGPTAPSVTDAPAPTNAPVTVAPTPAPVPATTKAPDEPCDVYGTLRIIGRFTLLLVDRARRASLEDALRRDIAASLHVLVAHINVTAIIEEADGVVVRYTVWCANTTVASAVTSTAASLAADGAHLSETAQVYGDATGATNITLRDAAAVIEGAATSAAAHYQAAAVVTAIAAAAVGFVAF